MRKNVILISLIGFLFSCNGNSNNKKVIITLDPNGGTISKTTFSLDKGTVYYDGLFPEPIKENHFFSHWTFENDETIPIEKTFTIENDATLKAQYTIAVTINFDTDGGSSIAPTKVPKGSIFKNDLFTIPTKQNFKFEKWVILNNKKEIEIPDYYEINSDLTLKAKWIEIKEKTEDEKYIESLKISKVENTPYLYSIEFSDYEYQIKDKEIEQFLNNSNFINYGKHSCSSVFTNGIHGRNFDLQYSEIPEFIIKTTATNQRHATLGISYGYSIKDSEVNTTKNMFGHKILPMLIMDGINDQGLCVSVNEVPSIDVGRCKGTATNKPTLSSVRLIRFILDYAEDIDSAEQLLKTRNIVSNGYYNELHFLISDKKGGSAVIEFKNKNDGSNLSDIVFYKKGSSNFLGVNSNFSFNDYTGDAENYTDKNSSLKPHSEGVERYNILINELKKTSVNTMDEMLSLLSKVYYTKTYSIPLLDNSKEFWFSEFNYSTNNKLTEHTINNYEYLLNSYKKHFHNWDGTEKRGTNFYCSRHSVAYDSNELKMKIVFEENNKINTTFSLT